jgi:lysophospholipase L1-like esterase
MGVAHPIFDQADPVLGNSLIPYAEGRQSREGDSFVRINSAGFRDRERSVQKANNVTRIAVLGDSFTEARQVDLNDSFCSVLEKELRVRGMPGSGDVEVLNFGISGHGTSQQLLNLRHRVWRFKPDVVVLAFYTGNDISDNSRALKGASSIPYHYYENSELRLDGSFADSDSFQFRSGPLMGVARVAMRHVRLLQLINHARLMKRLDALRARGQGAEFAGPTEPGMRREVYVPPESPAWQEAWRVTEGLLSEMHNDVRAKQIPFFVASLSSGVQVHPDLERRSRFLHEREIEDLLYPDRRVEAVGAREGFPVLLLAPYFQKHAEANAVFLHGFEPHLGFGHWNENGHRLAGERIARWLVREIAESRAVGGEAPSTSRPSLY